MIEWRQKEACQIKPNNKFSIPEIGFGTWNITGVQAEEAASEALKIGYRLIDTARIYGNEYEVGQAVNRSSVPREEIMVTSKLWPSDFGYDSALRAFDGSVERLRLDYVDLYLIHWPGSDKTRRHDAWRAMADIYKQKRARAIGVSNFTAGNLRNLLDFSDTPPAVNQIEFHPYVFREQRPILDFCKENKIAVEAYSPLSGGHGMNSITAMDIAERTGRTPAQVLLRWAMQHGTIPIPKTVHAERMKENLDVFNFELPVRDMEALDSLSG
ncbi:MAG TPA: aldo/keto reductase [Candidatus Saccharimonadales bacterium]|nr:aldo/keto reductase [Candidatus Saccharimonadales bacterium]